MQISENGINLIKKFEGCVLQVYLDAVGVKTLGYGHTGPDVNALPVGARISQQQADVYLKADLSKFARNVLKYDDVYHWTQNEFDAMVSFAFNIGSIDQLVNRGKRSKAEIAKCMLLYNKAGGKVLKGLARRRQAEHDLFVKDGLNVPITVPKSVIDVLAQQVIDGVWGTGVDRKMKLEAAGHNYYEVQQRVNEMLKGK